MLDINGKIKSYFDFYKSRGATENFLSCKKFLHLLDMENNSQENVIEPTETAIDINSLSSETKDDNINNLSSVTKDEILRSPEQHRESIDEIIVPQYIQYIDDQYIEDNYVVTYSKNDNSLVVWTINIEQNGQQHPDVYFKLDKSYKTSYKTSSKLYKKTLLFCYEKRDLIMNVNIIYINYRKYLFDTKI